MGMATDFRLSTFRGSHLASTDLYSHAFWDAPSWQNVAFILIHRPPWCNWWRCFCRRPSPGLYPCFRYLSCLWLPPTVRWLGLAILVSPKRLLHSHSDHCFLLWAPGVGLHLSLAMIGRNPGTATVCRYSKSITRSRHSH